MTKVDIIRDIIKEGVAVSYTHLYITIPAEFVGEQFKRFHRYPIRQRFETMTDYILEMMKIQYNLTAVSYTHLDVYKRQIIDRCGFTTYS